MRFAMHQFDQAEREPNSFDTLPHPAVVRVCAPPQESGLHCSFDPEFPRLDWAPYKFGPPSYLQLQLWKNQATSSLPPLQYSNRELSVRWVNYVVTNHYIGRVPGLWIGPPNLFQGRKAKKGMFNLQVNLCHNC